jgi:5'(3')-deoxyribonucleotidase
MIGIDIDSVTCDLMTPLLGKINKKFDMEMTEEDIKEWYWDYTIGDKKVNGLTEIRAALRDPEFVLSCPLVAGANDGVEWLANTYGKEHLMFITGRQESICGDSTREWIGRNFGDFNTVFASSNKNGYGLSALIDDAAHTIESFSANEDHVLAILYDRPWNRSATASGKSGGFWRARSWDGVTRIFSREYSNKER